MLLNFLLRTLLLLSMSSRMLSLALPIPEEQNSNIQIKVVENKPSKNGSLGGGLDNFISDMLNRIIQRRLENLLQGVSSSPRKDFQLLESSEPVFSTEELNYNSALEEKEGFFEAELPLSVTEIPSEVLTNLPG